MTNSLVTIALATYFPNATFLEKQLNSLNNQSYSNLELLVCDDSGDQHQFELINAMVLKVVTKFPVRFLRNEKNIGSNQTFEKLTRESTGDFIAYCDQDDIWLPEKISTLLRVIKEKNVSLAYSDLSLINENDDLVSKSMLNSSFRMKHVFGKEAFNYLIENNSVTGCAMLIKSNIAKKAIPFPDDKLFVHDHWLAICAAAEGEIGYSTNPLVSYRIHGQNQIGTKRFHDLNTAEMYVSEKIELPILKLNMIRERFNLNNAKDKLLKEKLDLLNIRNKQFRRKGFIKIKEMKILANTGFGLFAFESILFLCPRWLQKCVLHFKNNTVLHVTKFVNKIKTRK